MNLGAFQQVVLALQLRRLHLLQVFLDTLEPLFHLSEIVNDEVEINVLDIAQWIDGTNMSDGVVFKGAHHVGQSVHIAQVRGEGGFVQRLLAQRRHVGKLDTGVHQFLGVVERGQAIQAIVGDLGYPQMRLAWIAATLRYLLLSQHHEQRRFAHLGQANDSGFHGCAFRLSLLAVR